MIETTNRTSDRQSVKPLFISQVTGNAGLIKVHTYKLAAHKIAANL